ncbi:AI-2E family transporter [Clostridium sp.]|uniref:AI-2E family transporter n=1 Tax=Clostridium sp. TaxID=1506 RepID=UPI001E152F0F|nr:AI-2E family transporter [Clostridium sp.]MBS5985555.1 AI-2E family transporter [Clostridium sp.]
MNIIKKHKNIIIKLSLGILFLVLISIYIFNLNIRKIFNLVLLSFIIAYILKPLKIYIAKHTKIKEKKVALLIILGILIIAIFSIVLLIPTMFKEMNNIGPMINKLTESIEDFFLTSNIGNSTFLKFLYEDGRERISSFINSFSGSIVEHIIAFSEDIMSFAVVPVITYYFLADDEFIWNKCSLLIPIKKRELVKKIIKDINKLLESYIVGQLLLSLIVGIITFIALILVRVKFPLWLSILNGIFNIIPYFGPIFGAVPVVFIALLESPTKALWAALAILIIQQVEGNILSPKITGNSTNMHPLVIIILLLIGESFCGFVGMILAVPIGVIIKVIYEDINYYIF